MHRTRTWTRPVVVCAVAVTTVSCALAFDRPTTLNRQPNAALRCAYPPDATVDTATIVVDGDGGTFTVLENRVQLVIPRGAVRRQTFFVRELRDTVGVEITPSLTFDPPALIKIDVGSRRCRDVDVDRDDWGVWRQESIASPWVRLPTARPFLSSRIVGRLEENSIIMIAD